MRARVLMTAASTYVLVTTRGPGQDFTHLSSFEERKDLSHETVLSSDRPNYMEAVVYF